MSSIIKSPFIKLENKKVIDTAAMVLQSEDDYNVDVDNLALTIEETKRTAKSILERANSESEAIVKNAKAESVKIFENAVRDVQKHIEELKKQAYDEAYARGCEDAQTEATRLMEESEKVLRETYEKKEETLSEIEPKMIELVVKIADKLLGDTVKFNHQVILHLIKKGLSQTTVTGNIKIHVSPDDYDLVIGNKNDILEVAGESAEVEILRDFSLKELDCIIETQFGNIECSLDQQFLNLKENLYYILENR